MVFGTTLIIASNWSTKVWSDSVLNSRSFLHISIAYFEFKSNVVKALDDEYWFIIQGWSKINQMELWSIVIYYKFEGD